MRVAKILTQPLEASSVLGLNFAPQLVNDDKNIEFNESRLVEKLKIGKKRFRCTECGQRFNRKVKAIAHTETHLRDANFKCHSYKDLPTTEDRIRVEASIGSDLSTPRLEPSLKLSSSVMSEERSQQNTPEQVEMHSDEEKSYTCLELDSNTDVFDLTGDSVPAALSFSVDSDETQDNPCEGNFTADVARNFKTMGFHIPRSLEPAPGPQRFICGRCGEEEETKELLQKHINIGSYLPDRSLSNEKHAAAFCDVCNIHICKGRIKHFIRVANHRDNSKHTPEEFEQLRCNKCQIKFSSRGEFIMHMLEVVNHLARLNEGKDYRVMYAECPGSAFSREELSMDGDYEEEMAKWQYASDICELCEPVETQERHASFAPPDTALDPDCDPSREESLHLQPTPPYSPCPEHLRRLQRLKSDESLKYGNLRDVERVAEEWGEEEDTSPVEKLIVLTKGENRRRSL